MQQQRLHELLIEQVTRAVPVAVGIPRNPSPERHGASPCPQTCSHHEQISDPSPKYECKRSSEGEGSGRISFRPAAGRRMPDLALDNWQSVASEAHPGVGAALDSKPAALAISSIMGLPPSNMPSRSKGPAELIVSRKGSGPR